MTKLSNKIKENRRALGNPYAYLSPSGDFDAIWDSIEAPNEFVIPDIKNSENPYASLSLRDKSSVVSKVLQEKLPDRVIEINKRDSKIQQVVNDLQAKIWRQRHQLWPNGVPSDPVDLLNPSIAFESIGYDFDTKESLGIFTGDKNIEVAGIIDQSLKQVRISRSSKFPYATQRFTAAHELGHALLHEVNRLHRDRAIDGSYPQKEPIEIEANKFAAFFLMPKNLVETRFKQVFKRNKFVLNEATIYALDPSNSKNLINKCKTKKCLAKILASTEFYNGQHVNSLANQFKVSVGAMAIRLEELDLFEY